MSTREEKLDVTLEDNGGTAICRAAREGISEEVTNKLTLEFRKSVKQRATEKCSRLGNCLCRGPEVEENFDTFRELNRDHINEDQYK